MNAEHGFARRITWLVFAVSILALLSAAPVMAGTYRALDGVDGLDTMFEFSQGNPKVANLVFWAVRDTYTNADVKGLAKAPNTIVVFHGPVVKIISTDTAAFNDEEKAEIAKFHQTIKEMKQEGVTFEVCDYAVKVFGVDVGTILPEIDHVPNGFVSVSGYQQQGYAVIRVP